MTWDELAKEVREAVSRLFPGPVAGGATIRWREGPEGTFTAFEGGRLLCAVHMPIVNPSADT